MMVAEQRPAHFAITNHHPLAWFVAHCCFLALCHAGMATAQDCQGIEIHGEHTTQMEIESVCQGALRARALLAQCHITQLENLSIRIEAGIAHPAGLPVFAYYECPNKLIRISGHDAFQKLIPAGSAYAELPRQALYVSLVAHEVTHAITFQNTAGKHCSRIGHEYIAAVIQVASMEEAVRQKLLMAFPRSTPVQLEMFNEFSLYAAPQWFVANAYRHATQGNDRCAFFQGILKGEVHFPGGPE